MKKEDITINTYSINKNEKKGEETEKKEKRTKCTGLRFGAFSIIFIYISTILYFKPFNIDQLPYGISINDLFILPESFIFLGVFVLLSLLYSFMGTIISIFRFSILAILLNLIVIGTFSYFGTTIYNTNTKLFETAVKSLDLSKMNIKIVEKKKFEEDKKKEINSLLIK